jgi:HEAT repeats
VRRPIAVLLGGVALLGLNGSGAAGPDVSLLAARLRELYSERPEPWERWGRRPPTVRLPDGRRAARETAYRDLALFPEAAAAILAGPAADDAPFGAWLLGTRLPDPHAESMLADAVRHSDRRAAFEAARALGDAGTPGALAALEATARDSPDRDTRTTAAWAAERIAERHGVPCPPLETTERLSHGFQRGACWWFSEARGDAGRASFATLASLGVGWVSVHTWDPLQRALDDPKLLEPHHRLVIDDLGPIVQNAHTAGLRVMVKPHLEMRRHDQWHNLIEMRSEADWAEWFRGYGAYLLDHAARAQAAGADIFCVGRELDRTVIRREADWRRLIAQVRGVFHGPLVYSANFDSYEGIAFWDALDYVGISAYFSLSSDPDPVEASLEAGWARVLPRLEAVSRRFDRPVLLTEVGYPASARAAERPWDEGGPPAEPWLQARCYEATLRALAARPWIRGAYWWLWEGTAQPPFRDPSYSIQGKPAAFVLARWYRGL